MTSIEITVPDEIIALLGSEEAARKEAKEAFVLDLVRREKISKGKAAELIGISLWDLPEFLAQYHIPWITYSRDDLERDLQTLNELKEGGESTQL